MSSYLIKGTTSMFGLRELKFQEQLLPISGFDGLAEVQALPLNPSYEKKTFKPWTIAIVYSVFEYTYVI